MSLLEISDILALSVNIFTDDHKDSLCNLFENLLQSIQMQLFNRQKTLFEFWLDL